MSLETKYESDADICCRNWNKIQINGNLIINKGRRVSLILKTPSLKVEKANPLYLNNELNEALHFAIPFLDDRLYIFLDMFMPHPK